MGKVQVYCHTCDRSWEVHHTSSTCPVGHRLGRRRPPVVVLKKNVRKK